MPSPRVSAAKIIVQVSLYHHNADAAIAMILQNSKHSSTEVSLIKAYCFGTLRWFIQLKYIINQLLHKPLAVKHQDLFCLLCVALHELMHMRTPTYAVVNETVNGCKELKKDWAKGLINKILQQFLQQQQNLKKNIDSEAHIHYAHPAWLLSLLQQAWPLQWQAIAEANNHQAPLFLRVNTQKISVEAYQQLLQDHHITAKTIADYPCALHLDIPCAVEQLPGFYDGLCSVQDLAGQQAIPLLQVQPGQIVLDACAAPGSKTCYLLEHQPKIHKIVALDKDQIRLQLIAANIQRLQLPMSKVELQAADASQLAEWWTGQKFDRIMLDAPCSATGVIRRHPDIKLLRHAKDIITHAQVQLTLLTTLWQVLKPGGLLLYTTCSVLPQENVDVITQFLSNQHDAESIPISIKGAVIFKHGIQLLPSMNGWDGFYYALIAKK